MPPSSDLDASPPDRGEDAPLWIGRLIPIDHPLEAAEGLGFLLERRYVAAAATFQGAALVVGDRASAAPVVRWYHSQPQALRELLCARLYPNHRLTSHQPRPQPKPTAGAAGRRRGRTKLAFGRRAWVSPSACIADGVVIGPFAVIGEGVKIGPGCVIGAHAVVEEGCDVGEGCVIGAHAVLGPRVRLGRGCVLGPHAALGQVGFGLEPDAAGSLQRLPHVGGVFLEDDVQVGAHTCVDAGTFSPTLIGQGSRLDNLVHVAHNVRIGRRCLLLAQVGVAGSATIEDGCILAGQVGVAGHLRLGSRTQVAAQAGVAYSSDPGARLGGSPAFDLRRWQRTSLLTQTLDQRLSALDQRLRALESSPDHPNAPPPDRDH